MSLPTYRAAIIGLGFIGGGDQVSGDLIGQNVERLDGHHRQVHTRNPRTELVAGCDLDAGRRERFAERTGAATFDDWRAMLQEVRPDIVSVATSSPPHAEITIGCAQHQVRAVYCEKPIATTLEEAEAMLAACEESGTLLAINHNRRFSTDYRRLAQLVESGQIGDLVTAEIRWSAGRLGCTGTHLVDLMRFVTGRQVEAVSATLDERHKPDCRGPEFQDPGGWGLLRMEGGAVVSFSAANHSTAPLEYRIEGTEGTVYGRGRRIELQTRDGREDVWPSLRGESTSMDRALAEIVDWLDHGGEFSVPAIEAVRTFEVLVACHASHARNGAWVSLPLQGEDRLHRIVSG